MTMKPKALLPSTMIQRRIPTALVLLVAYLGLFHLQTNVDSQYRLSILVAVGATGRIVGGTPVMNVTAYPFYAFPNGGFLCGASLIWGNVLVTAAHCGVKVWGTGVRLGGIQRIKSQVPFYNTSKIVVHPNFDSSNYWNDVALIFLTDFIANVSYATMNNITTVPAVGSNMTAIGYGRLSETGNISRTLQEVDLPAESFAVCARTFRNLRDDMHLCNRGLPEGGKNTCNGDSGGPLFVKGTTNIVGLVSFGIGCARPNIPAVNVRISSYTKWIQDTICSQTTSFRLPSYCLRTRLGSGFRNPRTLRQS